MYGIVTYRNNSSSLLDEVLRLHLSAKEEQKDTNKSEHKFMFRHSS